MIILYVVVGIIFEEVVWIMDFFNALQNAVSGHQIRLKEPMSKHTTFRVGGPAQYYISVSDATVLQNGITCCRNYQIPYYVLGNGSNILVSDAGLSGVVFQMDKDYSGIEMEGNRVRAQAGALLGKLGKQILEASLTGFEWAAGIPGTVGGAVYMNAGAYGGEMKDILQEVTVLTKEMNVVTRCTEELQLSYRHSALMEKGDYVLDATFLLEPGEYQTIKDRMEELAIKRRQKQPLEYPSAGSTFKRPEGYFAGKLIQDAGLRGYRVGGAMVSEKHCGFVINYDHATAHDIYQLTEDVNAIVQEKFHVPLEREICLLGEF